MLVINKSTGPLIDEPEKGKYATRSITFYSKKTMDGVYLRSNDNVIGAPYFASFPDSNYFKIEFPNNFGYPDLIEFMTLSEQSAFTADLWILVDVIEDPAFINTNYFKEVR